MDILTVFVLPTHEHGISLHLCCLKFLSFFNFINFNFFNLSFILKFSKYRSVTSLVKFIPKYFILFGTIVNGIIFYYLFILREWACEQERAERENPKEVLHCQHGAWGRGPNPWTVRSWPEPKSRVRRLADWATQVPPPQDCFNFSFCVFFFNC